jgi:calcium/calmodulin-dependent protein kinase I
MICSYLASCFLFFSCFPCNDLPLNYQHPAELTHRQILTGLAYIHSKNIVHRDLKPENILYRTSHPDSQLVIADFGISRVLDGPDDLIEDETGSAQYSSPEVVKGQPHGLKADIWSVG